MPKQYKIDKVAEIESSIEANAGVFVVSYNGLTVKQAQELRHQLRELGAEMKVYKNNLVRIALENKEQPNVDDILVGPLAYVFYENEPVEAAKALKEFASPGVFWRSRVAFPRVRQLLPRRSTLSQTFPPRISSWVRSPVLSTASLATSLFASTAFPAVSPVASSRSLSRRRPSRHRARGRKAAPLAHMRRAT